MNAFHVVGGTLAVWALFVSFLGLTREGFPRSKGVERAVMLVSLSLFLGAVSSAVLTAVAEHNEEQEREQQQHEAKALLLPR